MYDIFNDFNPFVLIYLSKLILNLIIFIQISFVNQFNYNDIFFLA